MLFVLIRSQESIDELDEANNCEEEGPHADRSNVFASIPLGSLGVWAFTLEVPAACSTSDKEITCVNQEEDYPEEVENMKGSESIDTFGQFEVLVRVAVLVVGGSSKGIVAQTLQDPQGQEGKGNEEHYQWN